MAVELRNLLGGELGLGRPLPATLVFDYPSVEAITDYLVGELLGSVVAEAEPVAASVAVATGGVVSAIEELSDDEVDRLLADKMGRSG
jgi:hypothetical protein